MTFLTIPPVNDVLRALFLSQVQHRATCWVWKGRFNGRKGIMRIGDQHLLAHRVSYAWFVGDLDPEESGSRGLWAGLAGRALLHDRCLRQRRQ
jgi:hypothetical protein